MALMNRTTGENSRDEASKAQHLFSAPRNCPPPPLSFQERGSTLLTSDVLEQTSHSQEPDKLVLTWQTINKLNKLELENSLLKESLSSLTAQMTALKEEQKQFFQMAETTMNRLDLSVSDFNGRIDSLSAANRQLQRGINAAMSRASDEIVQTVSLTLHQAQSDLSKKSEGYVSRMEAITSRATRTFTGLEHQIRGFAQEHLWLTLAFYGSLIGHLIGCIQWISKLL